MAPPKSSNSLAGCTIAFAGNHAVCTDLSNHTIGMTNSLLISDVVLTGVSGDLKTYIASQGGAHASKVTDECTHLVANQKQYDAKGAKGEQHCSQCPVALAVCLLETSLK